MLVSKKYLHDKLILSLVSVNIFLALICMIVILFRFGADGNTNGYIVQYRANLGISEFKPGGLTGILNFIVFAPLVAILNTVLSMQVYHVRRQLALVVLGLGTLLLVLSIIVSNALLVLR